METKLQLIRLLANGEFHSGETLAKKCGISRAAVWKQLATVEERYGVPIHSVKGRGYRLACKLDLLDSVQINEFLDTGTLARIPPPEIKQQVDSTNSYLMQKAREGIGSGASCFAEQQTAGRGRRGRCWVSPYGNNIYMSLYREMNLDIASIGGMSLGVGIAVFEVLKGMGIEGIGLKWPNDLLYAGRKLGGILIEVAGEQGGPTRVVIGLGLNTSIGNRDARAIDQPWADLSEIPGGRELSRNLLAARLLEGLVTETDRFEQEGFSPLANDWNRFDVYHERKIRLQIGSGFFDGVHKGVNEQGSLLMKTDGATRLFNAGEISLREISEID